MTTEDESRRSTQVLVVGAGPTGLLLASELERRGVSCVLIDALDAPRDWDRATVVHPRSMEIFEALVDSVVGLSADTGTPSSDAMCGIDASVAARMGVEGVAVLAVRPDRYTGLRHDGSDPDAGAGYLDRLVA